MNWPSDPFSRVDPVNLKYVLGDIQTNRGRFASGRLPHVILRNDHPTAMRCRGAGVVHHNNKRREQLQQGIVAFSGPPEPRFVPLARLFARLFCRVSNRRENPIPFRLDWNNQLNQTSVTLSAAQIGNRNDSRGYSIN